MNIQRQVKSLNKEERRGPTWPTIFVMYDAKKHLENQIDWGCNVHL